MKKMERRVSRRGLTTCQSCKCHIKVEDVAISCPFCGYHLVPDESQAPSRSGLKRRSRSLLAAAMLSTAVTFSAAPMGCACYGGAPLPYYGSGSLATDQPANTLVLGRAQPDELLKKSFLLYNKGDDNLTVNSIRLSGNKTLELLEPQIVPFVLSPGRANGQRITVQFRPESNATARIEISSSDADNVNSNGSFIIKILHSAIAPDPKWNCGGTISFGDVALGETVTKECLLSNRGNAPLAIESIAYAKNKGGDNIDFKWVSPGSPVEVQAGQSIPVMISYTPSDTEPLEDGGHFVINEGGDPLWLQVRGSAKAASFDVVGLYPPCETDADCASVDQRFVCRKDPLSTERQCVTTDPKEPLLKLPPAASGEASSRAFLIRNLSDQPLTIKSLTWATEGPFEVKTLVPLPVTLPPKKRFQASVVYTPTSKEKASNKLQIEFDHASIPTASLLVEYAP